MSSPANRVHFDQYCTLIPEGPLYRPRFTSRSLSVSLPMARSQSDNGGESSKSSGRFTLKLPSFTRKPVQVLHIDPAELKPCLVSRSSSQMSEFALLSDSDEASPPPHAGVGSDLQLSRTKSSTPSEQKLSTTFKHRRSSVTQPIGLLPIRDCCITCLASMEHALDDGYVEPWSRNALRKKALDEAEKRRDLAKGIYPYREISVHKLKVDETEAALGTSHEEEDAKNEAAEAEEHDDHLSPLPDVSLSPRIVPSNATLSSLHAKYYSTSSVRHRSPPPSEFTSSSNSSSTPTRSRRSASDSEVQSPSNIMSWARGGASLFRGGANGGGIVLVG